MSDCGDILGKLNRNRTYQPIIGVEQPLNQTHKKAQFERILKAVIDFCGPVTGKRFLDVGCYHGYFSFQLAKMGAQTIGVEFRKNRVETCKCLSKFYGLKPNNPTFINSDIRDYNIPEVDYVILFNVFNHILSKDEEGGWKVFNKLLNKSKVVFIMMRHFGRTWRFCDKQEEVPQLFVERSEADNYKILGKERHRLIFAVWKLDVV